MVIKIDSDLDKVTIRSSGKAILESSLHDLNEFFL